MSFQLAKWLKLLMFWRRQETLEIYVGPSSCGFIDSTDLCRVLSKSPKGVRREK
jgi:hypothetical protein